MKLIKFFCLLLLPLLFSCSKKEETKFPDLDTDPLTKAYRQNKISGYVAIKFWKKEKKIVNIETAHINAGGFVTQRQDWYETQYFKYDSINRMTALKPGAIMLATGNLATSWM